MSGIGTIVNAVAIAGCGTLGVFVGRGIQKKYQETILYGLALCVMLLGLQMAFKGQRILLTIVSLVLGSLSGEALDLEGKMEQAGRWLSHKVERGGGDVAAQQAFTKGFLDASLIYCVGAMAIVGSIQDGLTGDPTILYTKAMIDGLTAIMYAANMGIGVAFAALPVLLYQGVITLLAGLLGPYVTDAVLQEISASGGLMILGIGMNMAGLTKIRVGNMLPGLLVAALAARLFG